MAATPQTLFPGVTLHKSIASRVFLDHNRHTAIKVYSPPLLVRVLYWLAFQAPFPYVRNQSALMAAKARRRIAGLLTQFWYGRDMVSPVIAISEEGGRYAYVTRLVDGKTPEDKRLAHAFMADLAWRFQQVGLPTWQINPRNPKAHENLIETSEGEYVIIDLESAVVSPMMPPGQWLDALRAGLLPVFDDVFLERTREYVKRREAHIRQSLGENGLGDLWAAIEVYERHWRDWRRSEFRLWARLYSAGAAVIRGGRRFLKALWLPSSVPAAIRLARRANEGELAETLVRKGVRDWRAEGRLDDETASEIETSIRAPEVISVLRHLSAHTAMSMPLRFPLGSIARPAWTLGFRAKAEWRALVRRERDEQTRAARGTHTGTVALIGALPGIGAGAYLAAEPLRRNRPLLAVGLDQLLRKVPFRVYERLHLVALTLWVARRNATAASAKPRTLRPSLATEWARAAIDGLRPHRKLAVVVLGVNAAALAAGGTYALLAGTNGAFQEWGTITTMKAAEAAAAGVAGVLVFRAFWLKADAEADIDAAAGSFFWLIAGTGLAWLAVDDYLQVHERLGNFIDSVGEVPLLNASDDLIVLGYGIGGLLVVAAFRGEIMRSPTIAALLGGAAALGVLMMAADFFAPHGSVLAAVEQPAHVMAVAVAALAFAVKYRETQAVGRPLPAGSPEVSRREWVDVRVSHAAAFGGAAVPCTACP